jgi:hypothetical protein
LPRSGVAKRNDVPWEVVDVVALDDRGAIERAHRPPETME